jgi:mannose-1-phosphate guanylyltransferase
MDAIVLVGGFGTRLLPLTKALPKPLIPLANVPFIERTVQWLRAAGVDHVILSLHYNAEQFMAHFARRATGVDLSFAIEETPLGTGGAIKNCERFVRSDRCFIFNGDIFTSLNLRDMLAQHQASGAQISLALTEVEDPSRYGVIETEADGRITAFTEKPPRELARSRDINAGVYLFERNTFDLFPDGRCSVERDVFPKALQTGVQMRGYREWPYWTDLGTPTDYLQAHRDILSRRARLALEAREIAPGIWLGEDVDIAADATVHSPVLLGNGARVASGASVGPGVVLGDGAVVEHGARVEDSVFWNGARALADAWVRGSIIGQQATVSGCVAEGLCEDQGVLHGA